MSMTHDEVLGDPERYLDVIEPRPDHLKRSDRPL